MEIWLAGPGLRDEDVVLWVYGCHLKDLKVY